MQKVNLVKEVAIFDDSELPNLGLCINALIVEHKNIDKITGISSFLYLVLSVQILVHTVGKHLFTRSEFIICYIIYAFDGFLPVFSSYFMYLS